MKKIYNILIAFIKTRWFSNFTREKLLKYQEKNIAKQFEYFKKKSPYFSKIKNLNEIKMNKKFMMENFDDLNTVGVKKDEVFEIAINSEKNRDFNTKYKNISVGLSSGTSGHRGIFITSEEEQGVWAGTILAKLLPKKNLFFHRIAFFLRADNNLYKSINSIFLKMIYFNTFENVENYIAKLNLLNPTILVAPPSILIELGKLKIDKILKINPRKIISVAEILEDRDCEFIKNCFNLEIIHQVYQATEGFLASTCEHGSLHLNEDIIKFEKKYVDDKRFYPIITDFKRKSQPHINYELNDILVESKKKCSCGSCFQVIEKIEGRADDIFKFIDKNNDIIKIFPDFIRRSLLFVDDVREYQVFQLDYNELEIAIKNINQLQKEKIINEFKKLFLSYNIASENIKISFIEYNLDRKVKLKRIHQKMKEKV